MKLLLPLLIALTLTSCKQPAKLNLPGAVRDLRLATMEELQSELCSAPSDNRAREDAIARLFRQAGASEVFFQTVGKQGYRNVYVIKRGRTDSVIVVGGHIDHVAKGDGVIDDWSGSCAVSNVYQALKSVETEHTLIFIGFAQEEDGLIGSRDFVRKLLEEERKRIRAMVNLECLGVGVTHIWSNGSDDALEAIVKRVAARDGIALQEHTIPGVGADSISFTRAGIPAITLDGLPVDRFELIHSEKDKCSNISIFNYYDSYRLAVAFMLELDKTGAAHE